MKWYIKDGLISNRESDGAAVFEADDNATEMIIPDGVTAIDSCTFFGCAALTSIVLPDSVTEISEYTFIGCTSLHW